MPDPVITDEASAVAWILERTDPANGDDAARLAMRCGTLCTSIDSTVAGVHAPHATGPHDLGRRAVGRALSDLAAMGAQPVGLTCAVLVPERAWQDAIEAMAGVLERAAEQGTAVMGGDLTMVDGASALALTIAVFGEPPGTRAPLPHLTTMGGARPGDVLAVTGELGAATAALYAGDPVLPEPPDRIAAGIALAPFAHAMTDLSDGIAIDAAHLAAASRCSLVVELDRLPLASTCPDVRVAAAGGDDYELLVALDPGTVDAARMRLGTDIPLTIIGSVADGRSGLQLR